MKSYNPRLNIDALIFSVNDVVIDVTRSYRQVVCKTVQLYLEQALGLTPVPEPLLTPADVTLLQKAGNFTDYRDLAIAFIIYFIELLPPVPVPTFPSKFHVPALIAYLQLARGGIRISMEDLYKKKDVAQLARDIAAAGGGLTGASQALPKINRHLLVSSGEITKTNLVGRIFQELYLGADFFERNYQEQALVIQSTGYVEHESLLIDPNVLDQVGRKVTLAAISNCPRIEVEYSLKSRGVRRYFQTVISLDDINEAGAKAVPDPWSLLEAARQLKPAPTRIAYIGSNPGDVQAAKSANETVPFIAIGCLVGAHDKEALREKFELHKANVILGHPDNLKELILD